MYFACDCVRRKLMLHELDAKPKLNGKKCFMDDNRIQVKNVEKN